MSKFDRSWLWVILSLAWMAVIYWLSDQPAGDYESAGSFLSWLPFKSTIAHVGLYFVLSAFVLRILIRLQPITGGLIAYSTVFVALIYGILDEIHQKSVDGRASEVIDVVADVFGAVLVVVFWFLIRKYRAGSDEKSSE